MKEIIKEELNVKNVLIEDQEEKLVTLSCKANFRTLGKKIGKQMKDAANIIAGFGIDEIKKFEQNQSVNIEIAGNKFELVSEDVLIERKEKEGLSVINQGTLTLALDTHLTKELIEEGIARQFIRHVQNLRKDKDFNITDRIKIYYNANENITTAIKNWLDIIKQETLGVEINASEKADVEVNVDEENIKIGIEKK